MTTKQYYGSIIYEVEESDGSITDYLKFKIDYCVVMYDKDGGGYPGAPAGCEIQKITCLQIDDNKDLDWMTKNEYEELFQGWLDSDDELYKNVIEMCFENANQYYEESCNED